jgi:hypothetical protein
MIIVFPISNRKVPCLIPNMQQKFKNTTLRSSCFLRRPQKFEEISQFFIDTIITPNENWEIFSNVSFLENMN